MSENQFSFKYDEYGNTKEILVYSSGVGVNSCSFVNKGTAFNDAERKKLGLQACLPPGVRQLDDQIENSTNTIDAKIDDIEKYIFIRALFDRNATLAHALIKNDFKKYLNIIYTPTISEVVKRYSSLFRQANGLHFYPGNIDSAEDILRRYLHRDIRIAVVSDNQGILGLGDQGAGGITICLSKLMLYSQAAGIAPWHCLPISLDVGTDNETLLDDETYLGWRHKRLKGEEYLAFIGRFVRAFRNVFPNAICQWEDFSKQNAFSIRDAFAEELISFNDDIQGSGAVALASLLSAMKAKGEKLSSQTFLINGAGVVGIGIAKQIELYLTTNGLSKKEAQEKIWILDEGKILIKDKRTAHYKDSYAKSIKKEDIQKPVKVIKDNNISTFIDTIGDQETFDENILKALVANTPRPIFLAMSSFSDDRFIESVFKKLDNKALVASAVGYGSSVGDKNISQIHNILVFPGVGLGLLASGAREVKAEFFTTAAETIAKHVKKSDLKKGFLLPSLEDLDKITLKIACAVAMKAVDMELSRPCVYSDFQHLNDEVRMKELITKMRWQPEYLPLVAM